MPGKLGAPMGAAAIGAATLEAADMDDVKLAPIDMEVIDIGRKLPVVPEVMQEVEVKAEEWDA